MNKRLFCTLGLAIALAAPLASQAAVSVSIAIAPPLLPVYVQPPIPAPGYIWTPGYWRWDPIAATYLWVDGAWVMPPAVGLLWTPGYWGWGPRGYFWHAGYWGPHVGFYGGVNYGYGYSGSGYHGGYWRDGVFNYNRSVNRLDPRIVHNVYNEPVVVENRTRVSFNGGRGGIVAHASADERAARAEHRFAPTPMQREHERAVVRSPEHVADRGAPRPGAERVAPERTPMREAPQGRIARPAERAQPMHEAGPRGGGGEHRGGGGRGGDRER